MSPTQENSEDAGAPAVPPSGFTAVNGSAATSTPAARSQPPPSESQPRQTEPAQALRRASTPAASASRSNSGSGDEGEGDGNSDMESSLAHSPITPTSQSHPAGDSKAAAAAAAAPSSRSGPIPFSASSSSISVQPLPNESPNNANTVHKRKRSSLSPHPHPPHPRTNEYTPSDANMASQAPQDGPAGSTTGPTNDDTERKQERQQSSEIRELSSGYGRQLQSEASRGLSSERGDSQENSYQNGDLVMLDSQPSQMSQLGPSQQLSHEQSQGYDGPTTPGMQMNRGIRDPDHKRKRIFSNRTKTGCITCRRRKKKCDEDKPECNNCKRGGFICEGYSGRVNWQKPQTKSPGPVTLLSRQEAGSSSVSTSPLQLTFSSQVQPQAIQQAPQIPPQASFQVHSQPQPVRIIERPPVQQHSQEYGMSQPPQTTHHHGHVMPTQVQQAPSAPPSVPVNDHRYQKQPLPEHRPHGSIGMPISGAQSAPVRRPPYREIQHARTPSQDARSSHTPQQSQQFTDPHRPLPTRGAVFSASEKEKMLNGEYFHAFTPELLMERDRCRAACWKFNNAANPTLGISRDEKLRFLMDILRPITGTRGPQSWNEQAEYQVGPNGQFARKAHSDHNGGIGGYPAGEEPWIEAPFTCDYGYNIKLGQGVFINFGCTIIDTCTVTIKARTLIGPNCQIYSGTHPLNPKTRRGIKGPEFGKPVTIEEDCWIAGNVTILPGVKIGTGATVGAGSVVTRDVPPNTVVAGNPAKVIKGILEHE